MRRFRRALAGPNTARPRDRRAARGGTLNRTCFCGRGVSLLGIYVCCIHIFWRPGGVLTAFAFAFAGLSLPSPTRSARLNLGAFVAHEGALRRDHALLSFDEGLQALRLRPATWCDDARTELNLPPPAPVPPYRVTSPETHTTSAPISKLPNTACRRQSTLPTTPPPPPHPSPALRRVPLGPRLLHHALRLRKRAGQLLPHGLRTATLYHAPRIHEGRGVRGAPRALHASR